MLYICCSRQVTCYRSMLYICCCRQALGPLLGIQFIPMWQVNHASLHLAAKFRVCGALSGRIWCFFPFSDRFHRITPFALLKIRRKSRCWGGSNFAFFHKAYFAARHPFTSRKCTTLQIQSVHWDSPTACFQTAYWQKRSVLRTPHRHRSPCHTSSSLSTL